MIPTQSEENPQATDNRKRQAESSEQEANCILDDVQGLLEQGQARRSQKSLGRDGQAKIMSRSDSRLSNCKYLETRFQNTRAQWKAERTLGSKTVELS